MIIVRNNCLLQGWSNFVDFSTGFLINGENKVRPQPKFMIISRFIHQDNNVYEFWTPNTISRSKKLKSGYKQTTPAPHNFNVITTKLPTKRQVGYYWCISCRQSVQKTHWLRNEGLGFIPAAIHSQTQNMMTRDKTIIHFSSDTDSQY